LIPHRHENIYARFLRGVYSEIKITMLQKD
jgi:hypothetical protein